MGYFSDSQIDRALGALEQSTHTMLISLMALWSKQAPLDDKQHYVAFGSPDEVAFLQKYCAPSGSPPDHPFYIPFYSSQGKSRWRRQSYPAKSLQAQRSRLREIFVQKPGSATDWALAAAYVAQALSNADRVLGTPPISLPAVAAWMFRQDEFKDLDAAVDRLIAELGLARDGLVGNAAGPSVFTRTDTAGIGDPVEPVPVSETALLTVLANRSPAPGANSSTAMPSATGSLVVDPEEVTASWEFDLELLKGIGGLQGMEEAAFAATAALRSGSHVVFIGPPGTGKTTLAEAICEAAGIPHTLVTATDLWTSNETIGGYFQMPRTSQDAGESIDFLPGLMLDAIMRGRCLIVDELNRADMDKCFGEFFSIATGQAVTLPYRMVTSKGFETLRLMPKPGIPEEGVHGVPVPSWWRLIGAMNNADKGSIRRLSQAFKRRFAFVPVPIPADDIYRSVLLAAAAKADFTTAAPSDALMNSLIALFTVSGKGFAELGQPLGPAIPLTVIRRAAEQWRMDITRSAGLVLRSVLSDTVAPLLSEAEISFSDLTRIVGPHVDDVKALAEDLGLWTGL